MKRIGIDVGGTNTDAVLIDRQTIVAAIKTNTTTDITAGIKTALGDLIAASGAAIDGVSAVMIGTTHYTNAVAERRGLGRAAAIRISLPASASLKPFCDWPLDLAELVNGGVFLVHGGHEYDGRAIVPMDETAVAAAAREIRRNRINAVAISATFSPLTTQCEMRAAEIVRHEHPDAQVSLSCALGRIGLLERENVALLNASLSQLSREITDSLSAAVSDSGLNVELFITQNDGTVARSGVAREFPVFSFASGPTNSMRGAALLTGIDDAVVCDVGGTTSDIGCLTNGFPREANNVVRVGGVRTLFRMPDLLSIAIGGGTVVSNDGSTLGPISVGARIGESALVFGGNTLTCTDIAVAAGLADIGDASKVRHLNKQLVQKVLAGVHEGIADAVDRMKTDATLVPLLAVGGGAMLIPESIPGICEVVHVPHRSVANAVGAAIAQISGETDKIYRDIDRDDAIAQARANAIDDAVRSGADRASVQVIEVDDLPISYLPGNAMRVRVRVVGEACLPPG